MRPAALRVGAFALAGLVLLGLALMTAGGRWFGATERAVMHFRTSVWGLQVGAPVVLRGVQVGRVTAIGLAAGQDKHSGPLLPVTAEFDTELLRPLLSELPSSTGAAPAAASGTPGVRGASAVAFLVERGLVARLATQSLLTGLLYVDLDLGVGTPAPRGPDAKGLPLIPTAPTRLQTLQAQLEGLDLGQIGRDLAAVAASTRELLGAPQARLALSRTAEAAQSLHQLAQALKGEAGPLAGSARDTLAQARRALAGVEPLLMEGAVALRGVDRATAHASRAASQVGAAAAQAQALAQAAQPLVTDLRRTADELAAAASTLREATAPSSPLRHQTETALAELTRAAVAMRALATLLEQHPNAIVWGRPKAP